MSKGLISLLIQLAMCCALVQLFKQAWGKERKVQRVTCGMLAALPIVALVIMHQV